MGFAEGMVICFIGGWLNSYLYSNHFRKKHRGFLFWFAVLFVGGLITLDYLIYINIIDVRLFNVIPWINLPTNVPASEIGQYWMFTPGLMIGLPIDLQITSFNGAGWDLFALLFFISYIWWFTIGQNLGRFWHGRLTYEKGAWYLMRSTKMVKRSMKKLEKKQQQREKS
jgi:hypothetical protein